VEVAKAGFRWPPARLVAANMQDLTDGVLRAGTPCQPGDTARVAADIARVHADFLLVHPFRDGNGRMARWLADLMAMQAGYDPVDYRFDGRAGPARRVRYLNAVKLGYLADYRPLAAFFADALAGGTGLGLSSPRAPSKTDD
jgi:cell filamentation protein